MRELFIDCSRGLTGDMLSPALLELCPAREGTLRRLNALGYGIGKKDFGRLSCVRARLGES